MARVLAGKRGADGQQGDTMARQGVVQKGAVGEHKSWIYVTKANSQRASTVSTTTRP